MDSGPYTRCPRCGWVATPYCVEYTPARGGGIDWSQDVFVVCACGYGYLADADDVLALDAETSCPWCARRLPCPAGATRVLCRPCGILVPAVMTG
jgi:hypothetical protein